MASMTPREVIHDLILSAEFGAIDNLTRARYARRGITDPTAPYGQSNQSIDEIIEGYQERYNNVMAAKRWFRDQVGGA